MVGCSIICAFGLASYIGQGVSMISAEVVPFLILAIGVDNIFIIANANKRAEAFKLSVSRQLGEALKEVGPSISTAAVCEFLAFIVGFTTNIPALQSFCLVAALAVIFDYIFQMTLFIAVLAMVIYIFLNLFDFLKRTKKEEEKKDTTFFSALRVKIQPLLEQK